MFIDNKYTRVYNSIVSRAQIDTLRSKDFGYYEKHHIVPKSLGGTNDSSNITLLTFKEHWTCHRLLCKMVSDPKHKTAMRYALYALSRSNEDQLRGMSHHQKMICLESNRIANRNRNHKPNLGNKHTEETKAKMRKASTGKKHSDETIQKIKDNNVRTYSSRSSKISEFQTGRQKSDDHKLKIAKSVKKRWAEKLGRSVGN